jgi:glycosyltransferase involved in cell wall biosynthesis
VGSTRRDFGTFGRAATAAGVAARIVCTRQNVGPDFATFGDSVRVTAPERPLTLREVVELYLGARAVAICLAGVEVLAGYWTLCDALAVGRPVIMTRHPLVDLDLEAEGVGRWVAPGDEHGWAAALRWFDDHPVEAAEMGRRARSLVDGGFDARTFAHQLMDVFDSLLGLDTRDRSTGAAREHTP